MSKTQLVTKSGEEITSKIPKGFFSNPENSIGSQNHVRYLGEMDTETRKWFLTNLSQNDLVAWAKDYHVRARSSEVPY